MAENNYPFPLAVQTVLPPDYCDNRTFERDMHTLQELGLEGVELNIAQPEKEDIAAIRQFLNRFGLRLTMFATGLTAKTQNLSLSSADRQIWERSVDQCKAMIDFVAREQTGIIIGFLKGGPDNDVHVARKRFGDALRRIAPHATKKRVRVLIEATNRYESAVANDLAATAEWVKALDTEYVKILPDTFHMNIEEAQGPIAALTKWVGYYDSVHLSDNNRFFPGLGAIDFAKILNRLKEIGYQGTLAIEGNIRTSFSEDIHASAQYLTHLDVP